MYVRPHLDFCDVIYHIPEIDNLFGSSSRLSYWMNRIESLQYQAALAITGASQGTGRYFRISKGSSGFQQGFLSKCTRFLTVVYPSAKGGS